LERSENHLGDAARSGLQARDVRGMGWEAGWRAERRASSAKMAMANRYSMAVWSEATKRPGWKYDARPTCTPSGVLQAQKWSWQIDRSVVVWSEATKS